MAAQQSHLLPRLPPAPIWFARIWFARIWFALAPLALAGCSWFGGSTPAKTDDTAEAPKVPVEQIYNQGVDQLTIKRYKDAVTSFDSVQENYPYTSWAVNAQLMQAYTEYLQQKYTDAIGTLDRFIQLHPTSNNIAYAYYVRALSYYEQIAEVQREQKNAELALNALQEVINRFPESAYSRDARLKIDLCRDHLAGHEMVIGRFYESQHLYAAAINRFQRVVDDFQTTNHVPEALHRLTEIYLRLGMPDEARKTAAILGHNYPGSDWYEDSWNLLLADGQLPDQKAAVAMQREKEGFLRRAFAWLF